MEFEKLVGDIIVKKGEKGMKNLEIMRGWFLFGITPLPPPPVQKPEMGEEESNPLPPPPHKINLGKEWNAPSRLPQF